jgi:hypothetical protein
MMSEPEAQFGDVVKRQQQYTAPEIAARLGTDAVTLKRFVSRGGLGRFPMSAQQAQAVAAAWVQLPGPAELPEPWPEEVEAAYRVFAEDFWRSADGLFAQAATMPTGHYAVTTDAVWGNGRRRESRVFRQLDESGALRRAFASAIVTHDHPIAYDDERDYAWAAEVEPA